MSHPGFPLKATTLDSGTRYVAIHFSADKDKHQAWEHNEVNNKGQPISTWKQEMGMHEDVFDGQPVFADYSDVRHCPLSIRESGIPICPNSVYIAGWDGGLTPAFALGQITPGRQLQLILEVTTEGDDPMETFVPKVFRACSQRIPGLFDVIYHTGDPTIWNRDPSTGESSGMYVKRKFGFMIRRSTNVPEVRRSKVTGLLLAKLENGAQQFIIDGLHCPIIRKGFQGAYQYELSSKGDTVGPGRIMNEPLKNGYSHVADAVQYLAIAADRYFDGKLNIGNELASDYGAVRSSQQTFVPRRPR